MESADLIERAPNSPIHWESGVESAIRAAGLRIAVVCRSMHPLGRTLDEYRRAVESFRWQMPAQFNFGRDVVDRWAEDAGRAPPSSGATPPAPSAGSRTRTCPRLARRAAHLFRSLGVAAGRSRDRDAAARARVAGRDRGAARDRRAGGAELHAAAAQGRAVPRDPQRRGRDRGVARMCRGRGRRARRAPERAQHFLRVAATQASRPSEPGWTDLVGRARAPARRRVRRPADARERSRARLLHLGHHGAAQGRAARPRLHLDPALHLALLARRPRGRAALDHERHGLGEGGLRRDLRAVERGRRGGALPRPLRAARRARVPGRDRRRTCSARRRPSSACS